MKARHEKERTKKIQSEEDAGFAKFYSDRYKDPVRRGCWLCEILQRKVHRSSQKRMPQRSSQKRMLALLNSTATGTKILSEEDAGFAKSIATGTKIQSEEDTGFAKFYSASQKRMLASQNSTAKGT